MADSGEITRWLLRLNEDDPQALDALVGLLYGELRELARARLRQERSGHTLNVTGLVNELYLRLVRQDHLNAQSRTQFYGIAALTMRRILVDYARARQRQKRGGVQEAVPIEAVEEFLSAAESDEILAMDLALERLSALAPRAAEIIQLRFYVGLTLEETAQSLGVSLKTVQRDWITARAWLRKEVGVEPAL